MRTTTKTLMFATTLTMLIFLAPASAANGSTTISTGEVHDYNTIPGEACPRVITTWTVTLTLTDPAATDAVSLSVFASPLPYGAPAGGGVATQLDPVVEATVTQSHGCRPPTQVTGIVADETPYQLSFTTGGGLPF